MEPEERQVMPGVTLTDFRKKEQQAPTTTTTVAGDQIEVVQAQIKELRNQIKHLVRSNAELEEALADEYDKDFAEAIEGEASHSFASLPRAIAVSCAMCVKSHY
jgi:hypothetical protein